MSQAMERKFKAYRQSERYYVDPKVAISARGCARNSGAARGPMKTILQDMTGSGGSSAVCARREARGIKALAG